MAALSAAVLANIANGALDFYLNKGTAYQQAIQQRPLLRAIEAGAKSFPGGKGNISLAVQGQYGAGGVNDSLVGYTGDDTVAFFNPTNLARLNYTWREHHIGISVTHTELKHDGISVTNEQGATSEHSGRDVTVLVNMWDNKLQDFGERTARSLNSLVWLDGSADAKGMHGLQHFLVADPSVGTVGGMNRATAANAYIRNRARTAAFDAKVTATPALGVHGGDAEHRERRCVVAGVAGGKASAYPLWRQPEQVPCWFRFHRCARN